MQVRVRESKQGDSTAEALIILFVRGSVAFLGGMAGGGDFEYLLRLSCLYKGICSSPGRKGKNSLKCSCPGLNFRIAEGPTPQQSCQNCRDARDSAHGHETHVFAPILRVSSNLLLPSLHRSWGRRRAERGGWGAQSQDEGGPRGPGSRPPNPLPPSSPT